jgi:hypothetical protein
VSQVSSHSNENSYKENRLEDQINWYSHKAQHNKINFRLCQIIILVAGSIIPIINVVGFGDIATRIISSVVGAIIVIATGITQLEKYHENWIIYRTTSELLKKEKYFFENSAGEYYKIKEEGEKSKLLVERVEAIVSSETSKYFTIHQVPQKERNDA